VIADSLRIVECRSLISIQQSTILNQQRFNNQES